MKKQNHIGFVILSLMFALPTFAEEMPMTTSEMPSMEIQESTKGEMMKMGMRKGMKMGLRMQQRAMGKKPMAVEKAPVFEGMEETMMTPAVKMPKKKSIKMALKGVKFEKKTMHKMMKMRKKMMDPVMPSSTDAQE